MLCSSGKEWKITIHPETGLPLHYAQTTVGTHRLEPIQLGAMDVGAGAAADVAADDLPEAAAPVSPAARLAQAWGQAALSLTL
jgi:hypothetical protein